MRWLSRWGALSVALLAGCVFEPTEVLVTLGTNVPDALPMRITMVARAGTATTGPGSTHHWRRVPGAPDGGAPRPDASSPADGGAPDVVDITLPATFGVTPRDDRPRDHAVTLVFDAEVEPAVPGGPVQRLRRVVAMRFVPRRPTPLRIFLSYDCLAPATGCTVAAGAACNVSQLCEDRGLTCGNEGLCVPIDVGPDLDATVDARPDAVAPADAADVVSPGCMTAADCDDRDVCNGAESCVDGRCATGSPLSCDDGVACTRDSCAPATGCAHAADNALCTTAPGGTCDAVRDCQYPTCTPATCTAGPCQTASCSGDMCVRASTCGMGQVCCAGACATAGCDDGNPCTTDSCGGGGCVNAPNTDPCSDGNACTSGDRCAGGACSGTPMPCADAIACTVDSCSGGTCVHTRTDALCPTGQTCQAGGCCGESPCRYLSPQCGCAAGRACYVDSTGIRACRTHGSLTEGQACPSSDPSSCALGLACVNNEAVMPTGICVRYCDADAQCPAGPGSRCAIPVIGAPGAFFCSSSCEPALGTGCNPGNGCQVLTGPGGYFSHCINNPGPGRQGAGCTTTGNCDYGFGCVNPGTGSICVHYCNRGTGAGCSAGTTCRMLGSPPVFGGVEYGVCL